MSFTKREPVKNISSYMNQTQFHQDYMIELKPVNLKKIIPYEQISQLLQHNPLEYLSICSIKFNPPLRKINKKLKILQHSSMKPKNGKLIPKKYNYCMILLTDIFCTPWQSKSCNYKFYTGCPY